MLLKGDFINKCIWEEFQCSGLLFDDLLDILLMINEIIKWKQGRMQDFR